MGKIKSTVQEGVGFVEEETGEMLHDKEMAHKGRALRNKGRLGQGKAPKLTEPGEGKKG